LLGFVVFWIPITGQEAGWEEFPIKLILCQVGRKTLSQSVIQSQLLVQHEVPSCSAILSPWGSVYLFQVPVLRLICIFLCIVI